MNDDNISNLSIGIKLKLWVTHTQLRIRSIVGYNLRSSRITWRGRIVNKQIGHVMVVAGVTS